MTFLFAPLSIVVAFSLSLSLAFALLPASALSYTCAYAYRRIVWALCVCLYACAVRPRQVFVFAPHTTHTQAHVCGHAQLGVLRYMCVCVCMCVIVIMLLHIVIFAVVFANFLDSLNRPLQTHTQIGAYTLTHTNTHIVTCLPRNCCCAPADYTHIQTHTRSREAALLLLPLALLAPVTFVVPASASAAAAAVVWLLLLLRLCKSKSRSLAFVFLLFYLLLAHLFYLVFLSPLFVSFFCFVVFVCLIYFSCARDFCFFFLFLFHFLNHSRCCLLPLSLVH